MDSFATETYYDSDEKEYVASCLKYPYLTGSGQSTTEAIEDLISLIEMTKHVMENV